MNRRTFLKSGIATGTAGLLSPFFGGRGWGEGRAPTVPAPLSNDEKIIRLDANENALGMAPSARQAIVNGISEANRYPFDVAAKFRKELSGHHKVSEACITLGCGSAEILQIVAQTYATRGTLILMADPTYDALALYARPFPARLERVPLRSDYSHDIGRMSELADKHPGPVLVYICNPNNPTGTVTACSEIQKWIQGALPRVKFFIDEAYHQFVNDSRYYSFADQAAKNHNIIVARTFSKVYAMAGMRQGYSISTPETRQQLFAYSTLVGVNHLALVAASTSLRDKDFLEESLVTSDRARKILTRTLDELHIEYLPSQANFIMFKLKGTIQEFNKRMAEQHIRVGRPFPPMEDFCRLSMGLATEMETFCSILRGFRKKGWV